MRTSRLIGVLLGLLLLAACAQAGDTASHSVRGPYMGSSAGVGLGF